MKKFRFIFALGAILFFGLTILLTGCGGGGDEQSNSTINYSGSKTEAAITSNNAAEITKAAYQGGEFASAVITGAGAAVSPSGSFPGSCGGTASYTITSYNNLTGNFSGSLTFDKYCEENNILSGGASFSGRLNKDTSDFISLAISFNAITYTKGSKDFTLKGQVDVDYSVNPHTISYDVLSKDNISEKVFWWNTYKIETTDGTSYKDFSLSGKFYHPDYGYVTLSTLTSFRYNSDSATPAAGVLGVTGKMDTTGGNNTSAQLIVLSASTYHIIADTDGDASYEWDSGILNWQ
ncbi:MAG TPA: hypothetical protein PLP18_08190 [Smithellaceae bacterium]|nr:hypothetical protein [Smithellaceae bacterium]